MTAAKGRKSLPSGQALPETNGTPAPSAVELAKLGLDPLALAAGLTVQFAKGSFGDLPLGETYGAMVDQVEASAKGKHPEQRAMLIGQSLVLNSIFVEMARRSAANLGHSFDGMERYMRLALKAQAQSRATIEALDRLDNGHEQTVRHVHVDNRGGQAIVADQFHHHAGGAENEKSVDQPHAKGARGSSLSGSDPLGNGLSVPGDTGEAAVPHARGQGKRRAQGQS